MTIPTEEVQKQSHVAGGRILKHPEMGSLGYKEAESTLKIP